MNNLQNRILLCLAALLITAWSNAEVALGQDTGPTRITLTPAAESTPALKHYLLPSILDRRAGNAAVIYGKVSADQHTFFSDKETWDRVTSLVKMPVSKIEMTPLDKSLLKGNAIYAFLEQAARCEHCDWQSPIRDAPYFLILLPEIQQSRSFGRLLAARARLQIATGDFEGAIRTLQSGYALARHVNESPMIISTLVGIANAQMMNQQVQAMSQQAGSPNLYWALTALPQPLLDPSKGLAAERDALYLTFPELRNVERMDRNEAYWRDTLRSSWTGLTEYLKMNGAESPPSLTLLVMRCYPLAKKSLIASGMSKEQVEKLPVAQVVLINTVRHYNELRDEQFKWVLASFPHADKELRKVNDKIKASAKRRDVLPLAPVILPAMGAFRRAVVRSNRDLKVLRVMEAIRMYAANHDGRLPDSLDACPVPIPLDPVTGKPFAYRKEGDVARLTGPELPGRPLNYEIRIAK